MQLVEAVLARSPNHPQAAHLYIHLMENGPDPKKAEAYYDLGFLKLSKTPPDSAGAKALWDKVIELDPNGPLAQKVQNHMGAIMTPAPTGAAHGSGATPAPTTSK